MSFNEILYVTADVFQFPKYIVYCSSIPVNTQLVRFDCHAGMNVILVPHLSSGGDLISWKFFTDGAVARPLKSTRQDDNGSYRLSLWWKTSNRSSCRKFCAPCTAKITRKRYSGCLSFPEKTRLC